MRQYAGVFDDASGPVYDYQDAGDAWSAPNGYESGDTGFTASMFKLLSPAAQIALRKLPPAPRTETPAELAARRAAFNATPMVKTIRDDLAASNAAYRAKYAAEHRTGLNALGHSIGSTVSSAAQGVANVGKGVYSAIGSTPIGKLASAAWGLQRDVLHTLTDNPIWDIAQTGISFIPGIGQAVSAGMATAAAVGKGKALADIALAAAKGAVPGGPLIQAAFDIGVGLAQGQPLGDLALNELRNQVPGGELGKAAFDAARAVASGQRLDQVALNLAKEKLSDEGGKVFEQVVNAHRSVANVASKALHFPNLGGGAARLMSSIVRTPALLRTPVTQLAQQHGVDMSDARQAVSSFVNRFNQQPSIPWSDVGALDSIETLCDRHGVTIPGEAWDNNDTGVAQSHAAVQAITGLKFRRGTRVGINKSLTRALYRHGNSNVKKALLAHGLLARLHQNTGELDGAGGWVIRSGDTPSGIASKVAHDANRWRELLAVNPGLKVVTASNGTTQVTPFNPGQRITIPPSWMGTAAPVATQPVSPSLPITTHTATLRQGSTGSEVVAWQKIIGVSADGQFGPNTDAATRTWQRQHGLSPDGVVGPLTWAAAAAAPTVAPAIPNPTPVVSTTTSTSTGQPTIRRGSTGAAVRLWQGIVGVPVDGQFGPQTEAATKAWQSQRGLAADGIVGPLTWAKAASAGAAGPAPSLPPAPASPASDQISTAVVQAELAVFFQKHPEANSGLTPAFGTLPADLSGVFDDRTRTAVAAFQRWFDSRNPPTPIATDGLVDQATANALQATVTNDLNQAGGDVITRTSGAALPPLTPIPTTFPTITPPADTIGTVQVTGAAPAKKDEGGGGAVLLALLAAAALAAGLV